MVKCEKCEKTMNAKSIAKHMREQHNCSGPGKPRTWSINESGDWVKTPKIPSEQNKTEKRKAEGNISPADNKGSKK